LCWLYSKEPNAYFISPYFGTALLGNPETTKPSCDCAGLLSLLILLQLVCKKLSAKRYNSSETSDTVP
jgi:hypothetical protein